MNARLTYKLSSMGKQKAYRDRENCEQERFIKDIRGFSHSIYITSIKKMGQSTGGVI